MKRLRCLCLVLLLVMFIPMRAQDVFTAAAKGDLDQVKSLINNNKDLVYAVNDNKKTALHFAAEKGHVDIVRFLLDSGAEVNATTAGGNTALVFAAQNGHNDVGKLLLQKGAKVDIRNKYAMTPLFFAADRGNVEMAAMLIAYGGDINAFSPLFGTPLHRAVFNGRDEMVKFLLKKKANTTIQNNTGTVLHTAAIRDRLDQARLLIKEGADVNSKNNTGLTPLFYALSVGSNRCSDMAMPGEGEVCADYIIEKLNPKAMLPMGHKSMHKHFESFTRKLAQKHSDLQVACPQYGGDRIHFRNGKLFQ